MRAYIRSEWEKWKGLDREGRRAYFADYYLLPVAAVCAGIFIAALVLRGFLFPQAPTELYVAVYDLTLEGKACEEAVARLAEEFGVGPSQILLDDSFRSDSAKDLERLQVLIANHRLDAVIANDEITRVLAGYGYFEDVTAVLPGDEACELDRAGRLYVTAGYRESDEVSFEDNETGQGERKPYAVWMDGCSRWEGLTGDAQEYRDFAIVTGAQYPEHAVELLRYLLGEERS